MDTSMKRLEPESIGDVLRQALQQQGLTDRLHEAKAVAAWPGVVGEHIAAYCGRPYVNNGLMTIYVRSASLRQELTMSRSILIKLLNEAAGHEAIKEIRFK